jgi:signal transduction histidine kinase/CheY-like chemotaxis protein
MLLTNIFNENAYSESFIDDLIFHGGLLLITFLIAILFLLWRAYENKKRSNISLSVKNKEIEKAHSDIEEKNQTLNEKNYELIEAKEKAESASIAKQKFLSNMSHEIRTPLNAVIGLSEILMIENPREDQVELLRSIKFSGENLLVLINDILDFSKIEEGKIKIENTRFNASQLLTNLKNTFKSKAENKNLEFNLTVGEDVPESLNGDPHRLSQILVNLIDNAIKFTEEGKIDVNVDSLRKTNEDIDIKFSIRDTGIGISTEEQEKIFERFEQATTETTRKFGGSGLGLAIIRNLLRLQGTNIYVESNPGEGSEFFFTLTFGINQTKDLEDKKKEDLEDPTEGDAFSTYILLVEDNEMNMKVAKRFLERWDYKIDTAENGLEALDKFKANRYDLILMDLHMPEMDGWEATMAIRNFENDISRKIPIIALTADVMINDLDKLYSAGMDDYVTKPFNSNELKTKIEAHLGQVKLDG